MKNRIKISVISLLVLLFLCLFLFANKRSEPVTRVDGKSMDKYEVMMAAQQRAVNANELLCSEFDFTSRYPFPDDYAGDYISEDGFFSVYVTSEEGIQRYEKLLADYSDITTYVIREHSYNELIKASDEASEWVADNFDLHFNGPDIINNGIMFSVNDSRTDEAEKKLLSYFKTVAGNYCYEYNGKLIKVLVEWEAESSEEVSYPGGTSLGMISSPDYVTMTCNGYKNNKLGFVTCGHGVWFTPFSYV